MPFRVGSRRPGIDQMVRLFLLGACVIHGEGSASVPKLPVPKSPASVSSTRRASESPADRGREGVLADNQMFQPKRRRFQPAGIEFLVLPCPPDATARIDANSHG
jgi:hypothetical protein